MYRKEATEDEAGEYSETAKGRNWGVMYFPRVGHIEQLFHLCNIDHGGNCEESDRKRNSY